VIFFKLQFENTDIVKTPKPPEGDLKASPSGEVCLPAAGREG